MSHKNRGRTPKNKIIYKIEVTTDTRDIQKIVRKYYELYANKLDHLEKIDKFLETYNFPKLNQEEWESEYTDYIYEIGAVIKKLLEFSQTFLRTTPILLKPFQKFKRREYSYIHFTMPALSSFQNEIKTVQKKKIICQYPWWT